MTDFLSHWAPGGGPPLAAGQTPTLALALGLGSGAAAGNTTLTGGNTGAGGGADSVSPAPHLDASVVVPQMLTGTTAGVSQDSLTDHGLGSATDSSSGADIGGGESAALPFTSAAWSEGATSDAATDLASLAPPDADGWFLV